MILALLGSGCGGETLIYVPAPPVAPEAQAVIVHMWDASGESAYVRVSSQEVLEFAVPRWAGRPPEVVIITVAYYVEPPAALGLALGVLSPPASDAPRLCSLRSPMKVMEATLQDGAVGPWQPMKAELPERMVTSVVGGTVVPCARPDVCRTLRPEVVPLPGSATIGLLIPLDVHSVLVGSTNGRFWRAKDDLTVVELPEMLGLPSRAGAYDGRGEYWFVGPAGSVVHGPLEGPYVYETIGTSSAAQVTSIAFDPESSAALATVVGPSLVGADYEHLQVLRREPMGWAPLLDLDSGEIRPSFTRIRWGGRGDALITYGGPSILHYDGRVARNLNVGGDNPFIDLEINDVGFHPNLGAGIVADDGRLYVAGPPYDTWLATESAKLDVPATGTLAIEDGFLIGGEDGAIKQYYPEGADCPTRRLSDADADLIVRVGERYVVSGGPRSNSRDNSITWLTPQP